MDDNFPYLLAAFVILWVVVLGYVFSMYIRQRQIRREIDSLKEALKDKTDE